MIPVIVTLVVLALLIAWTRFLYRYSVDRPLWIAFSTAAAAVFFAVSGLSGYTVSRHQRFITHASWVDHVIWPEVGVGLVAGIIAVYFWRRAGLRRDVSG